MVRLRLRKLFGLKKLYLLVGIATGLALGLVYFIKPTSKFFFYDPPEIGRTVEGVSVSLGGFSGLVVESGNESQVRLLTITDRGPNAPQNGARRPFLLPNYSPRLVRLRLDRRSGRIEVIAQIPLRDQNERELSGLPSYGPQDVDVADREVPVDLLGNVLSVDRGGLDSESICRSSDGTIWVGEEYGPQILHFTENGRLLERFRPGQELPSWLKKRRANSGFEGLACFEDRVFAMLQGPLTTDLPKENRVRLIEFNTVSRQMVTTHFYKLESETSKIGDLLAIGKDRFLVIEQNGERGLQARRAIYEWNLSGQKRLVLDLVRQGFDVEKAEGLGLIEGREIIVISDNDFGLNELGVDPKQWTQIGIWPLPQP